MRRGMEKRRRRVEPLLMDRSKIEVIQSCADALSLLSLADP